MATSLPQAPARRPFQARHVLFVVFGLMTLFVLLTRDLTLLDARSFLRQRYAAIPWLMILHGIPGAIALFLAPFQFSNRLRQRHLQLHRIMGRVYVGCVLIAAPVAVKVSTILVIPTLMMASLIQSIGWIVATATAVYCVRTGRIQQHREWMMRSYPFAMVFVVVRVILAIPGVESGGPLAIANVVWSVIATACFLPSFIIAWKNLSQGKPSVRKPVPSQSGQPA